MTTATFTTSFAHNTGTAFKAWATEYHNLMLSVGFTNTTDTGQLDIDAIVNVPASNQYAGFKIYYLNDSLHSVRPVYVKVEYGTSNVTGTPGIRLSFGFATDGAGLFVGPVIGPNTVTGAGSGGLTYPSYAAAGEGYGWLVFKIGYSSSYTIGSFAITRSCSVTGVPTNEAVSIVYGMSSTSDNCVFANIIFAGQGSPLVITGGIKGTVFGGRTDPQLNGADVQYWRTYIACPRVRTDPFIVLSHSSYNGIGAIKSLSPITGLPARNYISVNYGLGQGNSAWMGSLAVGTPTSPRNCPMLIWE